MHPDFNRDRLFLTEKEKRCQSETRNHTDGPSGADEPATTGYHTNENQYLQSDKNLGDLQGKVKERTKVWQRRGVRLRGGTYGLCTVSKKLLNWFGY